MASSSATSDAEDVGPAAKRARRSSEGELPAEAVGASTSGENDPTPSNAGPDQAAIRVEVNGIAGRACVVDASRDWSIQKVQEVLFEKLGTPVSRQTLLQDTRRLTAEALLSDLVTNLENVALSLTLVIHQAPQGLVNFVGLSNGLEQLKPGHLRKAANAKHTWEATAVSSEGFRVGAGSGLRFAPAQENCDVIIGLGGQPAAPCDCDAIDFAVYCCGGHLVIYERGGYALLSQSRCRANSFVELRVSDKVEYFLNGQLEHTTALGGQETLYAMASFCSAGAEVVDIQWI